MISDSLNIKSIEELKPFLIKLIREDVKGFKVMEGSGLLPYKIERTSMILEKLGVKVDKCKFCDILYPFDMLNQIKGKRICGTCKEDICGNQK